MSGFLPKGYVPPSATGSYTKFAPGTETRLRVLSKPYILWEVWKDKEVTRYSEDDQTVPATAKEVWHMIVYNYNLERMEIWSLSQLGIKKDLQRLDEDAEYGSPFLYDLKVGRVGSTINDTKYSVTPSPPKPVSQAVKDAYSSTPIDLKKLLTNDNPFGEETEAKEYNNPDAVEAQPVAEAPIRTVDDILPTVPADDDGLPF